MKRFWLSLLVVMVVVVLSACGDSNSIEGTWKISDIDKDNNNCEAAFTFQDNGNYKVKLSDDPKTYHGKYKEIDDDKHLYKLKLEDSYVSKIKRDKDSLTMSERDGSKTCTFDKK